MYEWIKMKNDTGEIKERQKERDIERMKRKMIG